MLVANPTIRRQMELSLVDLTPGPQTDASRKAQGTPPEPQINAPNIKLVGMAVPASADAFLDEAKREYEEGRVDLPLWSHVISKREGDQQELLDAYLKARATALRLELRENGGVAPKPRRADPKAPPPEREGPVAPVAVKVSVMELLRGPNLRKAAVFALPALAVLVIGAGWLLSGNDPDEASEATIRSRTGVAAVAPGKTALGNPAKAPKAEIDPVKQLESKIQELKAAGNWNVYVLYVTELTRKQPDNASAWRELSMGYANLDQYNDALDAGSKAAQLAPDDVLAWRNLGQINLDLNEPEAALKAFERAAALDVGDLYSQLNVGAINAQLNRLPQARAAFDGVLATNPENQDAMCGAVQVAQRQGRGNEVENMVRTLRSADHKCAVATASVGVAAPKVQHPGATYSNSGSDAVAVPKANGARASDSRLR